MNKKKQHDFAIFFSRKNVLILFLKMLKTKIWRKCATFVQDFQIFIFFRDFQIFKNVKFWGDGMLKKKNGPRFVFPGDLYYSLVFFFLFLLMGKCRSKMFKVFRDFQDFSIYRRFFSLPP